MSDKLRILVHVDEGVVQSVSSNLPIEAEVVTIDYNIEGADEHEISIIPQSDDPLNTAEALIGLRGPIGLTNKYITKYLDELEG